MKKLDWYILKRFLTTFFFMLMVIMLIAVVFDVSEKIERLFQEFGTTVENPFRLLFKFCTVFLDPPEPSTHLHLGDLFHLETCKQH